MKKVLTAGGIFLAVLFVVGMVFAMPLNSDETNSRAFSEKRAQMDEVRDELLAAIEANDYSAWVQIHTDNNLVGKGNILEVINEDNFDKFVEMHEYLDAAREIANELGIDQKGPGFGNEMGQGNEFRQGHQKGMHFPSNNQIEE